MVGLVSEPTEHTWHGTVQADVIHNAVTAAGFTYLTYRQVDTILDALKAAGHLAEPATNDSQPEPDGHVCALFCPEHG